MSVYKAQSIRKAVNRLGEGATEITREALAKVSIVMRAAFSEGLSLMSSL